MKKLSLAGGLLSAVASLLMFAPGQSSAPGNDRDFRQQWDTANPREMHRVLARQKAHRHERARAYLNSTRSKSLASQSDYDVTFYEIAITVDHVTTEFTGAVGVHGRAVTSGLNQVDIDFTNNLTVDSVVGSAGPLAFTHANELIAVQLGTSLSAGDPFAVTVYYHGIPSPIDGFHGLYSTTREGKPLLYSLSEPYYARTWWPCKDRTDDKADSFDIAITVDTSLYVASNGTLDSTILNGDNTNSFYYRVRYPMTTYLFSLSIYDYAILEDEWVYNNGQDTMPIVNAAFPEWDASGWSITPDVLTALSSLFGEYPFVQEKYGHANVDLGLGLEHQTISTMGDENIAFGENLIVHEVAHQWWGNMITCEGWQHIWLNEGWASYSEALYHEWKSGKFAYRSYMDMMNYYWPGTIIVEDTTDFGEIFDQIVYDKGAWVLHMLRGVLGDSAFFDGVRAYYSSPHKHASATTEEMRDEFEVSSGVELDWFFDQWIYGDGYPVYDYSFYSEPSDSGGYDVYTRIVQSKIGDTTLPPDVFDMPVQFAIKFNDGSTDSLVARVYEDFQVIHWNLPDPVQAVWLDPLEWIQRDANSAQWTLYLMTHPDSLAPAEQFLSYTDTIAYAGGINHITFEVTDGSLPPGLTLENRGVITGTPTDSGQYTFTVNIQDNIISTWHDELTYTLQVEGVNIVPGDIAFDSEVNISDLTFLVAYSFSNGPEPFSLNAADVNATCDVDIADITYLVAFMFSNGPAPLPGCVTR